MKHICYITGKEIPDERIEVLKDWGIPEHEWTHVDGAKTIVEKKRAAISDEDGNFFIADKLGETFTFEDEEPREGEQDLPEPQMA
jgi:hypothetical protein